MEKEFSKEEVKKYIERKADEFQKPIQYQLLALEEMLKFQKNKMQKDGKSVFGEFGHKKSPWSFLNSVTDHGWGNLKFKIEKKGVLGKA